jgi:hypothetical protein
MHDPTPETDAQKLSDEIVCVVSQLQRMSAAGPLNLDAESVQHLVSDLRNIFRHSLELEKDFLILQHSHQRLARITGIYDVPKPTETRRAAFVVVAGTDAKNNEKDI